MPNRIIKQSAFESEKISAISDFDFRLWVGLITQADDAGRGDARPAILKGHIFPLRERVTVKDIDQAITRLAAAGCVSLYKVGGKPYYAFPNWADHQRVYNAKTKYPGPEEAEELVCGQIDRATDTCGELPRVAASCGETPRVAASSRYNPNPNLNPNLNPNPNTKREDALGVFGDFAINQLDDEELATALADFAQMRKTIKKPLTANAARLIIKKLREFPRDEWIAIVNQSVMNSWQGLFPLKDEKGPMRESAPTTGGVSRRVRESNAQCQKHGVLSDGMLATARAMLEEDV